MSLTVGLWLLVGHTAAIVCPQVTCSDTESHVCAQFSPGQVQLAVCPDTYWCDLDSLYRTYQDKQPVLVCSEEEETEIKPGYLRTLMDEVCTQRKRNGKKRLAQGSHPRRCESNKDCILEDGSHTECACALGSSGSSYCELAPNDPQVHALYSSACKGDGDEFLKEFLHTRYYVHLQEPLQCKALVFADIAVYEFILAGGSVTDFIQRHSSALLSLAISCFIVA